jgi:trehalose 2-sulfotransferase
LKEWLDYGIVAIGRQPLIEVSAKIIYDHKGLSVIRERLYECSHKQILMREETMQPHSSYLICATQFDGSTCLCEALRSTGIAGCPEEYFGVFELAALRGYRENAASTANKTGSSGCWNGADAVNLLAFAFEKGTSRNGVFGAKLLWSYFDNFVSTIRGIPMYGEIPVFDLLPAVFPNLQYIWFTSRNKVQQAISLWKATQMAMWDIADDAERQFVFNFEVVDHFVRQIIEHEMEWLRFFNVCDIQPFIIAYEDLVSNYEGTMHEVLKYLHLFPSESSLFTGSPLERHTDAVMELWCKRYYHIKQQYAIDSLLAP